MAALTSKSLSRAVAELCRRDADLAALVARCGAPALWKRPPGFPTLVYIILEQQVSLASARATYDKLRALLRDFTPQVYLKLTERQLRAAGVSRQKARYTRLVAEAVLEGSLPLARLARYSDTRAREFLTAITGVGDWTADVYLMSALRRPDLWPIGDLALVKAIVDIKALGAKPEVSRLEALGETYRPYRSVAAQLYWHHYLTA